MASVTWTDAALDEVEGIARGIAEDSPRAAADFVRSVFTASDRLGLFPRSGRMVPEFERDDLRELIVRPYRMIYGISGDQIEILHVVHGARLLGDSLVI
jgi:plasmid stabilization system protein ParE